MREPLIRPLSTFTVKKGDYVYMTLFGRVHVQMPCGKVVSGSQAEAHPIICERCKEQEL